MKYFYLILLTIFAYIANATSWSYGGKFHNDDNPGKCTFNKALILSPGEKVHHPDKETCAEVHCSDEEGHLSVTGCILMPYIRNCKWGGQIDKYAPYPECCKEHLICNDIDPKAAPKQLVHLVH